MNAVRKNVELMNRIDTVHGMDVRRSCTIISSTTYEGEPSPKAPAWTAQKSLQTTFASAIDTELREIPEGEQRRGLAWAVVGRSLTSLRDRMLYVVQRWKGGERLSC